MLGSYYEKGYGTKADLTKAYVWYKMSTDQNYKPAITALKNLEAKMTKKQISDAEKEFIKTRNESVARELKALKDMNKHTD